MKTITVGVALSLVLLSPMAQANKVKKLKVKAPEGYANAPVVEVYSTTGEKWNKVDKTKETTARVGLNAECKYEGKGNKAYSGNFGVYGFTQVGDEAPADFLIPHAKEAKARFRYEKSTELDVVQVCNTELEKRLSQDADLTKYEVLAKGFTVNYPAAFTASYYLKCSPTGLGFSDSSIKKVKVNAKISCAASDLAKEKIPKPEPVPIKRAKLVDLIKSVKFGPNKKHLVGTCPAQVEFNGSITSNRPGTVEYQYISHDGRKSPKFTLKFDKASQKKLRVWKRTINKEKTQDKLAIRGQTGSAYDYRGWYKLKILSPAGQKEIKRDYTLKCVKPSQQIKL